MSHAAQVPQVVESYFGRLTAHPIITEEFRTGRGWTKTSYRKRISSSWARKLRSEGVQVVALTSCGRTADFRVEELV